MDKETIAKLAVALADSRPISMSEDRGVLWEYIRWSIMRVCEDDSIEPFDRAAFEALTEE